MAIKDINTGTPTGQDLVLNGDDQLRQLKTDVKNTFPEMAGPPYEDADANGAGGTAPVTNTTMSSWEARIAALEAATINPEGTSIPVGGIIVWYGTLVSIPLGFKQCNGVTYNYTDGNQQTQQITVPDLRGLFVVGPDAGGISQGESGGTAFDTGAVTQFSFNGGVHSHSVATPAGTAPLPSHGHSTLVSGNGDGADLGFLEYAAAKSGGSSSSNDYAIQGAPSGTPNAAPTSETGSGGTHTHPNTTTGSAAAHTHLVDVTNPYGAYYYICYVADGTPA